MKVAHIIASSGLYGAEKWIFALIRGKKSFQDEHVILNLNDISGFCSDIVKGAHARNIQAEDLYTGGTFNPRAVVCLKEWLAVNKISIVHTHGYKSDIIGLIAARLARVKVLSTPHGWSKEGFGRLQIYEALDRLCLRFMDCVCPLSSDLFHSVKPYISSSRTRLILNGVDVSEIKDVNPAFVDSESFRVGYVGQLIERKDVATLIRAFSTLNPNDRNFKLIIVGDGPEKNNLVRLATDLDIAKYVDFLGYRKDALAIMKTFDVFVLPSLLEGIPRCLMEASVAGVPVISTDIPGSRDLISHGETGYLFKCFDHETLSSLIMNHYGDPRALNEMTEHSQHNVMEKYSNLRMANEYDDVYQSLAAE